MIYVTIKINLQFTDKMKILKKPKQIKKERKIEIEKRVNDIIANNNLNNPGFDLIKFLTNPKAFPDGKPFQIGSQLLDKDVTGILLVDDNDYVPTTNTHKLIVINSLLQFEPDYRKKRRFIIAHEYGHYILHKNKSVQYAHRDTSNKRAEIEQEADFFARCLLMPEEQINNILQLDFAKKLQSNDKVDLISRTFNVTRKKSIQRLKEDLNLI